MAAAARVRKDDQTMPQCGTNDGDSVRAPELSVNKRISMGEKVRSLPPGTSPKLKPGSCKNTGKTTLRKHEVSITWDIDLNRKTTGNQSLEELHFRDMGGRHFRRNHRMTSFRQQ